MGILCIELSEQSNLFHPGDTISGDVTWDLENSSRQIFLRLFWYTQGKGTEDVSVVDEIVFDQPGLSERRKFELNLPAAPYSFSGKLVSLNWALELVADSTDDVFRQDIVLSPFDQAIDLTRPAAS